MGLVKKHILYFIGLVIIGVLCVYVLIVIPHGEPFLLIEKSFFLLGLGLNTTILLWTIGTYLVYRWFKTKRTNISLITWGISFFVYSITFVAHIFRALGVADANENSSSVHFFLYRMGMIFFATGILYGLLRILTDDKKAQIYPCLLTIISGFFFFILGLFVIPSENPIEFTMYLFLFTLWIPVCFTMAYIFFYYGTNAKLNGPKIIGLGFLGICITYMAWAPWHFSDVTYIYFVWYFLFLLSLTPILVGFVIMSYETKKSS